MRKYAFTCIGIAILMTFSPSCSLFKNRSVNRSIERTKEQKDLTTSASRKDSLDVFRSGVSTYNNTDSNTETTIKEYAPSSGDIELSANFKLDTSNSGVDTVKLVDVKNKDVSISIFQNKKTNELTAKVTSKGRVQLMPFREIQIKQNVSNKSGTVDTSLRVVALSVRDSAAVDKSAKSVEVSDKKIESKPNYISIGLICLSGLAVLIGSIWWVRRKV